MLVASMNPCPCGYYGHPKKKCVCNEYQRTHYMSKISGPLLDRIDLQIEVQPVDFDQMSSKAPGEPSAAIRQRVIAARMLQERRFKDEPGIHCNAQMTPSLLHKYAEPNAAGLEKLRDAMDRMNMSARAYDRHHRRPRRHRRRPRPPHHGSHRLPQPRPPHLPRQ